MKNALALAGALAPMAAFAWQGFDIESGFGTTTSAHGPWTYGVKLNALSTTLFTFTHTGTSTVGGVTLDYWWLNDGTFSRAYKNASGQQFIGGEGTNVPAGSFFIHPDANRPTTTRFFDPGFHVKGVYRWTRLGSTGDTLCTLVENGILRDSQVIGTPYQPGPWKYFNPVFTGGLAADFSVEQNGAPTWDSTRLEAFFYQDQSTAPVSFHIGAPEYVGDHSATVVHVEPWFGKYPLPTIDVVPDAFGNVTVQIPLRGTIVLFLKPDHWLRVQKVMYLGDAGYAMGTVPFINGDCDDDNDVDIDDYDLLAASYGSVMGDDTYVENADLDGDGDVDIDDYDILAASYGLIGQ